MPGDFDTVKERVDIVQLISERVPLKKVGRAYSGLCPFHSEKTPSFTVDPDRRTYHCFGCGKHGDIFTWLEELDGIEPVEALKVLAERAGVELTSRRDPAEQEREKRLLAANDTAHFYFRQALRGTERGKEVARYIADRGIHPETVEKFGLGYAPDSWDGLVGYLRKKGYSDEEVVAAGLVGRNDRGVFDWFRDRLIVPIKDGRGRIIAFGGRAMRADQRGKYVNSQGTALFNKSATLYALDAARAAVRKQGVAVIVEGYFDAIALHQAGFANAVASMGTALTEDQYHVLDAMRIERAIVAFDGDAAGQNSAERRGIDLAQQVQRAVRRAGRGSVTARTGLSVYVTVLPADTDPDDLDDPDHRAMLELLKAGKHPTSDLPAHLAAKAAALGASAPELEGEEDVAQAVEIAALGLRERNVRRRMKNAQGQLARANGGDVGAVDGEVAQLANELADLMHRPERHTVLHAADADERDE